MLHATRDAGGDRIAQINTEMHMGEYLGELDVGSPTRTEYEFGEVWLSLDFFAGHPLDNTCNVAIGWLWLV